MWSTIARRSVITTATKNTINATRNISSCLQASNIVTTATKISTGFNTATTSTLRSTISCISSSAPHSGRRFHSSTNSSPTNDYINYLIAAGAALIGTAFGMTLAEAEANNKDDTTNKPASAASTPVVVHDPDAMVIDSDGRLVPAKYLDMKVFSGTANIPLALDIVKHLKVPLGNVTITEFADTEIGIQVNENVRGKDIYIIQPTSPPGVNDNLMQLVLLISTMRRASARTITAVIPYYGYARQDRKMQSRVPISAADVARLLESVGVDRVVAVDLHCGQIQGFFSPNTPCDNLEGSAVALSYFSKLGLKGENTVVVSPDAGGVYRAKQFRDGLKRLGLDAGLAMIVKQRLRANAIERMDLVGSVEGCDVIMVDDMIDTAGTLSKAADELKARGAKRVFAFATHGLFSGPAVERIKNSSLEKVVVCNSIQIDSAKSISKIEVLNIAEILANAIERIQTNKSVSSLFKQ